MLAVVHTGKRTAYATSVRACVSNMCVYMHAGVRMHANTRVYEYAYVNVRVRVGAHVRVCMCAACVHAHYVRKWTCMCAWRTRVCANRVRVRVCKYDPACAVKRSCVLVGMISYYHD